MCGAQWTGRQKLANRRNLAIILLGHRGFFAFHCHNPNLRYKTNTAAKMTSGVDMKIGPHTKFIISTSGRLSSLKRYKCLLQDILQLDIAYVPIHSGSIHHPTIDPERFVAALKGFPCIGGAISKDIKHGIVPYVDEIDESASSVQSINTVIVLPDGKLRGFNTDVLGFRYAIENGIKESKIDVKVAVCYGSGGVASVVTSVLSSLGIKVLMAGRNMEAVALRSTELGVDTWSGETADLFVNATPASEHPLHEAANFLESLSGCKIAFDHEMPGRYLKEYCSNNGIYHIAGEKMYYPQMEAQWRLFLNGLVNPEEVFSLLERADGEKDK